MTTEEKIKQTIKKFRESSEALDPADPHLKKLGINFVRKLSRIIDMHPAIKSGQSKYIAEKALIIADALDIGTQEKANILYAGLLIQLGKIHLSNKLLEKPFYSMTIVDKYRYLGHAVEGESLLKGLTQFKAAIPLIRHQYEHYNGEGFPDGLERLNIPLGSRIFSVVSDYIGYLQGSMTGTEMFADAALSQLMIQKESHYDPEIVDIFANILRGKTVEEIKEAIAQSKLRAIATEQWRKGLLLKKSHKPPSTSPVVEIALPQLKPDMEVDSIYFGAQPYIKNCIATQSIINDITAFTKKSGKNPVIKIHLGGQ